MIKEALIGMVVGAMLAGTSAAESETGSGPLTLGPEATAAVKQWMALENPSYFFFSQDGRAWGSAYCQWGFQYCSDSGLATAREACQKHANGVPCRLFAVEGRIVWDGFDKGQLAAQ